MLQIIRIENLQEMELLQIELKVRLLILKEV